MDEYQQLKGVIGHQLAKLYLCSVRHFQVVGEEVAVRGLDPRARVDMVAKHGGLYRPVEVKLQACNHDWFGKAFEHIVDQIARGATPRGHVDTTDVELQRPILFLWYPPSKKFRPERYREVEVIQVGDALDALMSTDSGAIEEVASQVSRMAETFLMQDPGLRLSARQRQNWKMCFKVDG